MKRLVIICEKTLGSEHQSTATVYVNYAHLQKAVARNQMAIFLGKRAVNILQASREKNDQLSDESKKAFLATKEDTYRTVADWLMEAGRLPEAEQVLAMLKEDEQLSYLQRSKRAARQLNTRADCSSWEQEHCERLDRLSNELHGAQVEYSKEEEKQKTGRTDRARLDALRAELKTLSRNYQQGLEEIDSALSALATDPEYKIHLERDVLRRSNRLRRDLKQLGHGAVTLHYLVLEDKIRIILTTPEKQLTRASEINVADLRKRVGKIRQHFLDESPARFNAANTARLKNECQGLYQVLLAPVEQDLKEAGAETLMVSLDDILRYIPFSILHDGEKYLIENYTVTIQTLAAKGDLKDKPQPEWMVSGFGVSEEASIQETGREQPTYFSALDAVRVELDNIIKEKQNDSKGLLPGESYLNEQFTKARMIESLEAGHPVLHIASHFQLRPGDNIHSYLVLGDNKTLTMAEVYDDNMDFAGADLVTLSACDTANGDLNAQATGAEVESFGALIQDLGAKAVMATLWPVADRSTGLLMQNFYQLREQNQLTKAQALRQAQLGFIHGSITGSNDPARGLTSNKHTGPPVQQYSHPYYWAPFILMGNWL